MSTYLFFADMELASDPDRADIVLINTCAFIEDARQEAYSEILRACDLKRIGMIRGIVVTGCLPQRYGMNLLENFPEVDAWVGIDHLDEIPDIVQSVYDVAKESDPSQDNTPIVCISKYRNSLFKPDFPGFSLAPGNSAYLKIGDGCNHACAYCAIPSIRGRLRSCKANEILEEAQALIDIGKTEICIVAQDITAYGKDLPKKPSLASLLRRLDAIPGNHHFRLLYGYPSFVTDELIETIRDSKHILHYLDIPIQHSHPDVLRAMLRADTITHVANLTQHIRSICPDMTLRTTCLVGFPGETDEHFAHLMNYVKEAQFDHLGVFGFSCEEGTAAATLPNQLPPEIIEQRKESLLNAQEKIIEQKLSARIGSNLLFNLEEQQEDGTWIARALFQAPDIDGYSIISNVPDNETGESLIRAGVTGTEGCNLIADCNTIFD